MTFQLKHDTYGDLVIPSPVFGDSSALEFNGSINRNINGQVLMVKPSSRPEIYRYSWSFRMTEACWVTKDTLDQWFQDTAAQQVVVTDSVGRFYRGQILDTEIQATEEGEGFWDFSFELLGFEAFQLELLLEGGLPLSLEDSTCMELEQSV